MRTWPADYDPECFVLLPVPVATIPIVAGKLGELEDRNQWDTDSDWSQGYQFAVCMQECLMQCGQTLSETMLLMAVALGANEVDETDLSPVFPALAARLAAARTADTAGVLTKKALNISPSTIMRLSELLKPHVPEGDENWDPETPPYPAGANPNFFGVLRSAWNFDSIRVAGLNEADVAATSKEIGALLAVMAGLQEQPIADVKTVWPYVGTELENAQGREIGNGTNILDHSSENNRFSNLVRISELTRVLQGQFPNEWWDWLSLTGPDYPQLMDLYRLQTAGDEIQVQGQSLWDYLTGAVGAGVDVVDIVTDIGTSAVEAGSELAGTAVEGAGLILQAGLIGAITGLSAQLKTIQDNQAAADTNRLAEHMRTMNVLGGQPAMDDPQTLTGIPIFQNIQNLLRGEQLSDGRVNLWSLLQESGALGVYFDILLRDAAAADHTNLYNLMEYLRCICDTNRDLVTLAENDVVQPGAVIPENAVTDTGSVSCQRIRWLLDMLREIGKDLFGYKPTSVVAIDQDYTFYLGVGVPTERMFTIAEAVNSWLNTYGANWIMWTEWYDPIADDLRCVLYSATSPSDAYGAWNTTLDDLGAGALALPTVLKAMVWGGLLNWLFDGTLPHDPSVLDNYSSDCSDCTGGGSPFPTVPPGGWGKSWAYGRWPAGNQNAHPTTPELVAFWYIYEPTGETVSKEQFGTDSGPDRWTITDNLRGYEIAMLITEFADPHAEVYDNGVLVTTLGAQGNVEHTFTSDTTSVQIKIVSGYPGSIVVRNPSQNSGWPFS